MRELICPIPGTASITDRDWSLSEAVRFGIVAGAALLMTPAVQPCARSEVERLVEVTEEAADLQWGGCAAVGEALVR